MVQADVRAFATVPSLVAALIGALELRAGDCVTHVGCGTGYYTAVIAEVVGAGGRIGGRTPMLAETNQRDDRIELESIDAHLALTDVDLYEKVDLPAA